MKSAYSALLVTCFWGTIFSLDKDSKTVEVSPSNNDGFLFMKNGGEDDAIPSPETDEEMDSLRKNIYNNELRIDMIPGEIKSAKDKAIPLFGEAFFQRLEDDDIWQDVGSSEFAEKYLASDFPVIASIAHLMLEQHELERDLVRNRAELYRLSIEKMLYNLLPNDIYSAIRAERRVARQSAVKLEETETALRSVQDDYKALVNDYLRDSLQFSSEDAFTFADGLLVNLGKGGWDSAAGLTALTKRVPSYWTITVNKAPQTGFIIGLTAGDIRSGKSFHHASTYAFAKVKQTYEGGQAKVSSWPGWRINDVVVFMYDPKRATLSAHHSGTKEIYTIENLPATNEYRFYLSLYSSQSAVLLQPSTVLERSLFS